MTWGEELDRQHALVRLEREWREICKVVFVNYGPGAHVKIPKFVQRFAKLLFDQEKELRRALMNGDMPWFSSWLMRLDMMNKALIGIGFDEDKRNAIERTRFMLHRLSTLANHRLTKLGGVWPPT